MEKKETLILKETEKDIEKAAGIIRKGGLVAFPTETVYGLGADGLDKEAVKKIYEAKGRPSDNPMILHVSSISQARKISVDIPEMAEKLMKKFWPGPMTIVLKASEDVPTETTGGLDTVGIRMPADKTARKLIELSGVPIAAPSANLSGKPSPTKPEHVMDDLAGRIDGIIWGGICDVGIESTVLTCTDKGIVILRPGIITAEEIEEVAEVPVITDPALDTEENIRKASERSYRKKDMTLLEEDNSNFIPMAPGMKYRHYAPEGEMIVFIGDEEKIRDEIVKRKKILESEGYKVGVIFFGNSNFKEAAHDLFDKLREMDRTNVEYILAGAVENTGVGLAVMNRMLKSAGYNVEYL